MRRRILALSLLICALGFSQAAQAEFSGVRLFQFSEAETDRALAAFGQARQRDDSGFSVAAAKGFMPQKGVPLMENRGVFDLNDVVVACFTPRADMYVKIVDTNPRDETKKIFPPGDRDSAFVREGVEYCI